MKIALLIALVLGGGTSLAAQGAEPGDALYPVKIHINENVRSAFAVSAQSQAKLEVKLLDERLNEAGTLAAEGKLEGELAAEVRARINAQVQETAEASARLAARGSAEAATEVRIAMRESLNEFKTFLGGMRASLSSDVATLFEADADSNIAVADAALEGTVASDTSMEGEVNVEALLQSVEARIGGMRAVLRGATDLSADVQAELEADVDAAASELARARTSLEADARAEARQRAEAASNMIGSAEARLSTLGKVTIEEGTGAIVDFMFGGEASSSSETSVDGSGSAGGSVEVEASGSGSTGVSI